MFTKIRMAMLAATGTVAMLAAAAPSAQAGLLSLAPGACGQQMSQPFAQYGDQNEYGLFPGGDFEGGPNWFLAGGAQVVAGGHDSSRSLRLPAGSTAVSPVACTGVDHPSARLFVRNTGSSSSRLNVWATYTPVLGLLPVRFYMGQLSGSDSWQPSSPIVMGLLRNLVGSLNLSESTVTLQFAPADSTGQWQIDDVYLDPHCKG